MRDDAERGPGGAAVIGASMLAASALGWGLWAKWGLAVAAAMDFASLCL